MTRDAPQPDAPRLHVPPGHPYSPLPSSADIERAITWASSATDALPGIDLRVAEQLALLERLAEGYSELGFGEEPGPRRFGYANTWFTYADAVVMALMVRAARPRRIVEVGCGHSTALLLDANDAFLGGRADLTFIEPDAARLRALVSANDLDGRLLEMPVQDAPLGVFDALGADDVLAIDSSHVVKAGSDVAHLISTVLPRLAPGVLVHVHDVFFPFEYPAVWLRSGAALNEAYVLRALLEHSTAYRIELFTDYLITRHAGTVGRLMPLALERPFPTGGLWLRRL